MSNVLPFQREPALARLECTKCGVEIDAGCNCGVEYRPAAVRAAEAVAANPEKSNRAIAKDENLGLGTVNRARAQVNHGGSPEKRVGRDGKNYPATQPKPKVVDAAKLEARKAKVIADEKQRLILLAKHAATCMDSFYDGLDEYLQRIPDAKLLPEVTADDDTIAAVKAAADAWAKFYNDLRMQCAKR